MGRKMVIAGRRRPIKSFYGNLAQMRVTRCGHGLVLGHFTEERRIFQKAYTHDDQVCWLTGWNYMAILNGHFKHGTCFQPTNQANNFGTRQPTTKMVSNDGNVSDPNYGNEKDCPRGSNIHAKRKRIILYKEAGLLEKKSSQRKGRLGSRGAPGEM